MHLLIPHATSLSLAAQGGLSGLKLPALDKLLAQLQAHAAGRRRRVQPEHCRTSR